MFSNVIILGSKLCKQELKTKEEKLLVFIHKGPHGLRTGKAKGREGGKILLNKFVFKLNTFCC